MRQDLRASGSNRLRDSLSWLWLGLTALWLVLVLVTDQPGWPLVIWIATTILPIGMLARRDGAGGTTDRLR